MSSIDRHGSNKGKLLIHCTNPGSSTWAGSFPCHHPCGTCHGPQLPIRVTYLMAPIKSNSTPFHPRVPWYNGGWVYMCACATSPKLPKIHIRTPEIHIKIQDRILEPKHGCHCRGHMGGARGVVPPHRCGSQASGPSALFDRPKRGSPVQSPCVRCTCAGLRLYGLPYTYEILTLHTTVMPVELTSGTSVALPALGGSLFCAIQRRTSRNHPARAVRAIALDVDGHFAKWSNE